MSKEDFNYKKIPPFKWFVLQNFPFIEADFDALTEWQLLCKIGNEIKLVINKTNEVGFQVETLTEYVRNYFENLDIEEEVDKKLDEMVENGTFEGLLDKILNMYINYEQFGAKGDGHTDDYQAIKDAHEYANEHNLPVKTNPQKTYYIHEIPSTIPIKTNVDWSESKFIIDDTELTSDELQTYLFEITAPFVEKPITSLSKSTRTLSGIDKNYFVFLVNSQKRQYYQKGGSENGLPLRDTFLINSKGTIETPILYDFEHIDLNEWYEMQKPLTISGGIFTTIRSNLIQDSYVRRTFVIRTNNLTIKNVIHKMLENEEHIKSTYGGFFNLQRCYNVRLENLKLANYESESSSYEIQMDNCQNIYFDNVIVDDITNPDIWGVIGSNNIRNIYFNNCELNRIDSHTQAENIYINNSILGYHALQLTGYGDLIITNSQFLSNYFVNLRGDFGSSWNGKIVIKDSKLISQGGTTDYIALIRTDNDGTFNYGYDTRFPNIYMENIEIDDTKLTNLSNGISILSNAIVEASAEYKELFKEYIICKNVISKANHTIYPLYRGGLNCYSEKDSYLKGQTTIDYNTRNPRLKFKTNFIIELDNTTISNVDSNQNFKWNISASLISPTAENVGTTIINNASRKYLIPKITIKNNNNVFAYPTTTPCILTFENCLIKYIYNHYSGCISYVIFKNCIFDSTDYLTILNTTNSKTFDLPPDMTVYKDCYFAECSRFSTSEDFKRVFAMFNNLIYDGHNIFLYNKFENCDIYDKTIFDWLPSNYEKLYNIEILNSISKRDRNSLRVGTTSERPYNPDNGTLYFDTTLNKTICYNGSWIIPS